MILPGPWLGYLINQTHTETKSTVMGKQINNNNKDQIIKARFKFMEKFCC